jgi:hypothetical protein
MTGRRDELYSETRRILIRAHRGGETITAPASAITDVTVTGSGTFFVQLEVRDGVDVATCTTTVAATDIAPPLEVSAQVVSVPLRVTKIVAAQEIHVSFEDRGAPDELVSLYAGTIRPATTFAEDHAPVACKTAGLPVGAGVAELLAAWDPGTSRYYLVSASNGAGESPRGFRSDATEHPALPTDCGALP